MSGEATIEIACDAALCWSLLADPRLVPEWIAGVADADVVATDDRGRPIDVRFVGMPSTAAIAYQLAYAYDDDARRIRWSTVDDAERRVAGEAWIVDLGASRCRLHYALDSWAAGSLPRWARDTLADDTPARAVGAFQRFAERRATAIHRSI
jgi:hypothetical protein